MNKQRFVKVWSSILKEIEEGLAKIDERQVAELINSIKGAHRIFCLAAGRSKSILRMFCIRLNHLGLEAYEVGGIPCPPITSKDILIASTGSGSTVSVLAILKKAKEEGAKNIIITANDNQELRLLADKLILITAPSGLNNRDDLRSKQLMRALFEQIVFILQESIISILSDNMPIDDIVKRHTNLE